MYMLACIKLMFAQTGLHVHIIYRVPRDQGLGTGLVSRVCMAGIISIVCFSGHHIQNYTCKVYNISEIVIACSDNSGGYDFNRNISIVSTAI